MQIIGSLILGMIITILAVTLTIFYVALFVMGIGWLGQKLESLKIAWTQKNLQARACSRLADRRTSMRNGPAAVSKSRCRPGDKKSVSV
jgi:hypothetical protein